jgi:hypothetical protein
MSLFPKEHGAYGQLLFPIATAMAIGRPTFGALCLAAAVTCAFLGHEPLLVVVGLRGVRAQRDGRGRATRWLGAFLVIAAAFGAAAHLLRPFLWKATLVPGLLAAVLLVLVLAGLGRTVFAETLTAVTLASTAFPVALLCGATASAAMTCAVVFAAGMASASIAVRAVIARTRNPPAFAARAGAVAVAIAVNAALVHPYFGSFVDRAAVWTALPLTASSIGLALAAPGARHLRRVGWALIAATLATAIALVVTQR